MSFALDPNMAVGQAASQDLQAKRQQVESLSGSKYSDAERSAKLRDACEGFEAVFIQKMWEQMRATLPKDGFLRGKEEEFWQSMYDQELGKSMASSGGIGLADMMMEQLDRNHHEISDATRHSSSRTPMLQVPPASLLPAAATDKISIPEAVQPAAVQNGAVAQSRPDMSIYDGEAVQPSAPDDFALPAEAFAAAVQNSPVDETPSAVRQTLDELAALVAAQQNEAASVAQQPAGVRSASTMAPNNVQLQFQQMTGQAPYRPEAARNIPPQNQDEIAAAEAAPVVTHITYQTNLPPSQRKASPFQNGMNGVAQQVPLSTSTPTAPAPAQAPAQAVVQPGSLPSAPLAEAPQPAVAAPVAAAPQPAAPVDILAGIRPRFVPDSMKPRGLYEEAPQVASNQVDFEFNAAERPLQAGGPAISSPEAVTRPVSLGNPAPPKGSMVSPLNGDVQARMSSGFGWRLDPFTGQRGWHAGVDIKAEPGEAVSAAMPGVVTFAGHDPELGNLVVVEHGDGLRTLYGHNQGFSVEVGQTVNAGTEIARAGSSGRAAGTHVHFEVRRGDLALNPEPLLRQQNTQMAAAW